MANLIRSAKPGSDWTRYELAAYNITVVRQTKPEFFGVNDLPVPSQPTVVTFMTTKYRESVPDEATRKLLHFLDLALNPRAGDEAAVENFVAKLLEKLEYDSVSRIIFFRRSIPLYICGVNSVTHPDLCLLNDDEILLLVLHRKQGLDDTEPQIIAAAIAAYAMNNKLRRGSPPLPAITFPAITLAVTDFTFYKITVTAELSTAVQQGVYPATQTQVLKYIPLLPKPFMSGMYPLENRVELLSCLEAFKRFVGN